MSARPSGTVTFLFTDVVGSTALWDARPNDMRAALSSHDAIVRNMVDEFDGYVFSTAGDSFAVAFGRPLQAAYAALGIRSRLEGADWAGPFRLEVRFGLHTGTADERDGDYFGPHLNRAARLMSAGHGGQVVVSSVTAELLRGETGGEFALADLGEHYLRDVSTPTYAFQLDSLGESRRFPPLRSVESAGGNLPIQPSRFFGRGDEITEIVKRLGSGERLVTLAGTGGVGKTRLALQASAELVGELADGVWFVPLAAVTEADAVPYAVASVLAVTAAAGQPITERIIATLQRRKMLLVIDNCEHVLPGVVELIHRLLAACPGVMVLATSRQALRLAGERVVVIGPLERSSAAGSEIFIDWASLAGAAIGPEDEAIIRQICERLDGIPLAIELAAARARSASPAELLARLDNQMRVLAGRTGPGPQPLDRQLSMRQAIEWSYDLLGEAEQRLFERFSVFSGSVDFAAVHAVIGDGVDEFDLADLIDALVEQSMLVVERRGATTRYRLLEPLRQFALDRLHDDLEVGVLRARHVEYFATFVTILDAKLEGPDIGPWMTAADDAVPNIRTALHHALEIGDLERAFHLATRPWIYWFERIGGEQLGWQQGTEAAMSAVDHPLLANLRAHLALTAGQFVGAAEGVCLATLAIEQLPMGRDRLLALFWAFLFSAAAGESVEAIRWSAQLATEVDAMPRNAFWQIHADHSRALALWGHDRTASQQFASDTVPAARRLRNESVLAFMLANGLSATSLPEAIQQCDEAIELGDRVGLVQSRGVGLYMKAEYLARLPNSSDREVFGAMLAALDLMERGSHMQLAMVVEYTARAFAHRGRAEIAAQIFGAQAANEGLLPAQALADGRRRQSAMDAARTELGDTLYERHERIGQQSDVAAVAHLVRATLTEALATLPAEPSEAR